MMAQAHTHPKLRRFSLALRPVLAGAPVDPQTVATGLLERLWHYASTSHRSGTLTGVDAPLLAAEIGWFGDAKQLVDTMIACGWLDSVDGALSIHDWTQHCPNWVKAIAKPNRGRFKKADSVTDSVLDLVPDLGSDLVTDHHIPIPKTLNHKPKNQVSPPPPAPAKKVVMEGFDQFWQAYPRRDSRGDAEKAWAKAIKLATPEEIIAGAKRYAASRVGQDQTYTKTPGPWLNAKKWLDTPPPQRQYDDGLKDSDYGNSTIGGMKS